MQAALELISLEQGSREWLDFRKTKITATDAAVIIRASHWKTPVQLYHEKLSNDPPAPPNERMQRGSDSQPNARALFNLTTALDMQPAVIVKDWLMASLDGLSLCKLYILEIKCPGDKDHA